MVIANQVKLSEEQGLPQDSGAMTDAMQPQLTDEADLNKSAACADDIQLVLGRALPLAIRPGSGAQSQGYDTGQIPYQEWRSV